MRSLKSQLEALEDDINEDAPIEVSALESAKRVSFFSVRTERLDSGSSSKDVKNA